MSLTLKYYRETVGGPSSYIRTILNKCSTVFSCILSSSSLVEYCRCTSSISLGNVIFLQLWPAKACLLYFLQTPLGLAKHSLVCVFRFGQVVRRRFFSQVFTDGAIMDRCSVLNSHLVQHIYRPSSRCALWTKKQLSIVTGSLSTAG